MTLCVHIHNNYNNITITAWPKMAPNTHGVTIDQELEMIRQRFRLWIMFPVVTVSNTWCYSMEWVAFFSALSAFLAFADDASSSTGGLPGSDRIQLQSFLHEEPLDLDQVSDGYTVSYICCCPGEGVRSSLHLPPFWLLLLTPPHLWVCS